MSDAKPESAPKKSKKLLVVAPAVLLLAGGGAGAWYFLGHKAADGDDAAEASVAKQKHEAKPLFTTLDPFTVNLQDPRGERFAQIGVTLQFEDPKVEMLVKDRMPAVRNDILMLISSKQIEDLLSMEGKQKLAQEIRLRAGRALGVDLPDPEPAKDQPAAVKDTAADKESVAKADAKGGEHADPAASDDEDDDKAARRAAARHKKRKHKDAPENPIQQVLFSQFIVQ
ncbi:MAG: flagellar basal body-associated FliL family protein [Ramlibacter sp.]